MVESYYFNWVFLYREEPVEEEPKKEEKKLPVKEKEASKWSHDLYNETDQTPKSKEELSRAYGYDIFTEDQCNIIH